MTEAVKEMLNAHEGEIRQLRELVAKSRVVPFIGAGMSCSVGLPGWRTFVTQCASEAGCQDAVKSLLEGGDYPGATSLLERKIGADAFQNMIADSFCDNKFDAEATEPLVLIPYLGQGIVATTNFDNVAEALYSAAKFPFRRRHIGTAMEGATRAMIENDHHLLKIHGSHEEATHRVITAEEYIKSYGGLNAKDVKIDKLLPFLIVQLIVSRHALFLGCSLSSDLTMQLFHSVFEKTNVVKHFALVELPAETIREDREKELREAGIAPIWYPKEARAEAISAVIRSILPAQTPSLSERRLFECFGILGFLFSLLALIGFQTFRTHGPGPLFLTVGLPFVSLFSILTVAVATRFAAATPSRRIGQRLIPGFFLKMKGRTEWMRWLPFVIYIGFPLYVCGHLINMQKHLHMVRLPAPEYGHHHLETIRWPDYFSWSSVDMNLPFVTEPFYRWDLDKGFHAFPFFQPWIQTVLGVAAIALGAVYLLRCISGWRCNRLPTTLILKAHSVSSSPNRDKETIPSPPSE